MARAKNCAGGTHESSIILAEAALRQCTNKRIKMTSYSLDGIYHRMEENDCKKRFKNKLRFTISSSTGVCEMNSKKKVRAELYINWLSSIEFEVDWAAMGKIGTEAVSN